MLKRLVLAVSLVFAGANLISAATYYVAKTGSDSNAGSQAAPLLTISKAATKVAAGDTVNIAAGSYSEYVNLTISGTAANPITFVGSGTTVGGFKIRANYNVLTNLTLKFSNWLPLLDMKTDSGPCSHNQIVNCAIQMGGQWQGIDSYGDFNLIQGCTFSGGGDPSGPPSHYMMFHGNTNLITQNLCAGGNDIDFIKVFGNYNTISSNEVYGLSNPNYGNSEHTDFVQMFGSGTFVTVSGNYVHDCPGMQVCNTEYDITGPGTGSSAGTHDVYFINNVFANISSSAFSGIANSWFFNNIFYKVGYVQDGAIYLYSDGSTRTSSGAQIVNNVFLDCGSAPGNNWVGAIQSSGANLSSLNIGYNYFAGTGYAAKSTANGAFIGSQTVNGGDPKFAGESAFNFHLLTNSPLLNAGTNLFRFFPADKDGNLRPASNSWSIGPFAAAAGGTIGNLVNVAPTVSPIIQNALDMDPVLPGLQVLEGTVVQYSGSASDANADVLNWQWLCSINGTTPVVVQNGTGTVAPVTFTYGAGTGGNTYVWTLKVTDGQLTSQSTLTMGVETPPAAGQGLSFSATSGAISNLFVVTNGYIFQPAQTTSVTNAGRASYDFTVTNAGFYIVQASVNALTDSANSFFVNVDGEPADPAMIWDVNVTAGFEPRLLSWRGNGTDVKNQFAPQIFSLTPGVHHLVVRGREGSVQLQNFAILKVPVAPQGS